MRLTAIIAASLALSGCCFMFQCDPYYNEYTRAQPDKKDIIGIWTANARSLEWLKAQGYDVAAPPVLEFRADGTFTMTGMPDCWRVFFDSERKKTLESAPGKWRVTKHQEWWTLGLEFDRPPWSAGGGYGRELFLRRQKPPYLVHVIVGDPDAGNGIEFERK